MGLANAGMEAAKYHLCVYVKSRWTTFSTLVLSRSFDLVAFTTKWKFYDTSGMKRALCEESILSIFDVLWQENLYVFKMTVIVICSCKVF